ATGLAWPFLRSSEAAPARSASAECGLDRSTVPWPITAKPLPSSRATRRAPIFCHAALLRASFGWRAEMALRFETWLEQLREKRKRWVDASHENNFDRGIWNANGREICRPDAFHLRTAPECRGYRGNAGELPSGERCDR